MESSLDARRLGVGLAAPLASDGLPHASGLGKRSGAMTAIESDREILQLELPDQAERVELEIHRFRRSQSLLRAAVRDVRVGIPPVLDDVLEELLRRTLRANALAESRVRIQAGPGAGDLDSLDGEPFLLIEAIRFQPMPTICQTFSKGLARCRRLSPTST